MSPTLVIAAEDDSGLDAGLGQHFGGAPAFVVVDVDGGAVQSHRVVPNPHFGRHKPGAVPAFVARDLAADVLIVGGIGQRAVAVLKTHDIEVCAGFSGTVREGVDAYLRGERGSEPGCGHGHGHGQGQHGHGHGHGGGCGHGQGQHGHGHGGGCGHGQGQHGHGHGGGCGHGQGQHGRGHGHGGGCGHD